MKTLVSWQPWPEVNVLQRHLDEWLADLNQTTERQPQTKPTWRPAAELAVTDTTVVVRVALPGIAAADLEIDVTREAIALRGTKPAPDNDSASVLHSEFRYGAFQRDIALPVPVAHQQTQADLADGILTLTLPREQAAKPKVVKVKLSAANQPELSAVEPAQAEAPMAAAEPADVWDEAIAS